ncbi:MULTISPECIES: GxxExxY protein [Desulfotignum]|uniref:GxxExxY protein n=1 Tax=Desulfotignum TaxID=115780 RepID=UPI000407F482|nr:MULTISPECIES: GxxExxY protein [Desulfotignum]
MTPEGTTYTAIYKIISRRTRRARRKEFDDAQLLTYMKLADIRTGLLINFNVTKLKHGIKRFVL